MKTIVIYHRADFDGLFCREIARKFLPEAELIGWDYGDAYVKMPEEGKVYILDLSPECLDASQVEGLVWNRIIWIDHHKSAMDKFSDLNIPGYRIDGVAACRLAWQFFQDLHDVGMTNTALLPKKEHYVRRFVSEPLAVRLAGEYDIWDKRDHAAELFQHGLRSRELTENIWDILLSGPIAEADGKLAVDEIMVQALLEAGEAIQYAKNQENESIIKAFGFTETFEGLTFLCCNHARFNSHLFTAGIKTEHDGLLGFNWTGMDWRVSLYGVPGKPDVDLSTIAVKYGGGGHKQACGFRVQELPFMGKRHQGE